MRDEEGALAIERLTQRRDASQQRRLTFAVQLWRVAEPHTAGERRDGVSYTSVSLRQLS